MYNLKRHKWQIRFWKLFWCGVRRQNKLFEKFFTQILVIRYLSNIYEQAFQVLTHFDHTWDVLQNNLWNNVLLPAKTYFPFKLTDELAIYKWASHFCEKDVYHSMG